MFPRRKRVRVVRCATSLIVPGKRLDEIVSTIQTIAGISEPVTEKDVALTLRVTRPDMSSFSRMEMLRVIMDIPALEREHVIDSAVQLMDDQMGLYERKMVIRRVVGMVSDQRAEYS